jgi:hypothetical protein
MEGASIIGPVNQFVRVTRPVKPGKDKPSPFPYTGCGIDHWPGEPICIKKDNLWDTIF